MAEAVSIDGNLLARALAGSWRTEPPEWELSARELSAVARVLAVSGAGALAWRSVSRTVWRATAAAQDLRQAYLLQTLKAAVREAEIARLFALLDSAGVDAVLVKGWAASGVYAEPGLRPCGDIDLCVRPRHYSRAKDVLASEEGRAFWVDLHAGFERLHDGNVEELFERSRVARVCGARVRVLSEEDHLRLLCLHLLRHGAWRPLWLCDVAAALEARGAAFDWGLLLGRNGRRAEWVTCTLGLAHVLLGARVSGTPAAEAAARLPRWLVSGVLRRWGGTRAPAQPPYTHRAPIASYLREPRRLLRDLRDRWPGPVEATVCVGGRFGRMPRWPFQLANCFTRAACFVAGARRPVAW
ncbi:MAG TPA: nucleotidyltransferase family protein [Pyrinomonadaceae bacterium]|jgi:hypothetical protein